MKNGDIIFSPGRGYRYYLERILTEGQKVVNFCMLNPSTADELVNDPTVRRCIGYAQDWGYDRVIVTNIFAYRSTDPKGLKRICDPIGVENDYYIEKAAAKADLIITAWGTHGGYLNRGEAVKKILRPYQPHHLGLTKCLQPKHPLYLRKSLLPIPLG